MDSGLRFPGVPKWSQGFLIVSFRGTFGLLALELRVCLCGLGHVLNVPCWSSLGAGGFSLYYDSTVGGLCCLCFRGRGYCLDLRLLTLLRGEPNAACLPQGVQTEKSQNGEGKGDWSNWEGLLARNSALHLTGNLGKFCIS